MQSDEYLKAIRPAMELVLKKGEDYNKGAATLDRYFPFGEVSYVQMIHLKALRMVSLIEQDIPNFDSMQDTVNDLLNYTVFFAKYLQEQKNV